MPRIPSIALAAFLFAVPVASALEHRRPQRQERPSQGHSKGIALVTYKAKGIQRHVIYWGAEGDTPEFFRYDRSGGAVSKKIKDWRS